MPASLLAGLIAFLALGSPARADSEKPRPSASPATGDFSGRVAIRGGRRIYLECRGTGTPTVVLEAGTGDRSESGAHRRWDPGRRCSRSVAKFTRVCAYDRPGTYASPEELSRSDPVAMPRSARDIVRDLRSLLRAHVPGPYVLAGHSFGGMVARLYATTYPRRIAGLVSIDAQNEDFAAADKRLLTPEQYLAAVLNPAPPFEGYPAIERLDLEVSAAEMRQAQADTPLRRMPLVVLSHSRTIPNPFGTPSDWPAAELDHAFQESQNMLADLVPGARHVIATHSSHYIQLDQPKLVTKAIRSVVRRRGERSRSIGHRIAFRCPDRR